MKIRLGFVSNSSSSSYICDICGEDATGYDISLEEYEMYVCKNGHVFCEEHMKVIPTDTELLKVIFEDSLEKYKKFRESNPNNKNYEEWFKETEDNINELNTLSESEIEEKIDDEWCDYISESRYEYPPTYCPLCRFDYLSKKDVYEYVDKKYSIEKVKKEINEKFDNYEQFKNHLKND